MNFSRILVPTEFSEHSLSAVQAAAALAKQVSGTLTLLFVMPPMVVMHGEMGPIVIPPDPERRSKIESDLAGLKEKFGTGLSVETLVQEGHPWPAICDTAKEKNADLIVISSHGYTGLKRMLLGSTAEQVVRHAECPVMVVKSFKE
jgi:nucleotide-binding universal stress UspA family protein